MKKDYILTLATSVIIMVAVLSLYKMSTHFFGTMGFAEFSLLKRIISFLVPLFAVGVGVGLPREVARVDGTENNEQKYLLLQYALLIILIPSLVFLIFINIFSKKFALLFFSDESYSYLLLPIGLFIIGSLMDVLAYAYFRGLDRIVVSNVIQIINMAVVPIIVMIFLSDDVASFFGITGIIISATSLMCLWRQLRRAFCLWDLKILERLFFYSIRRLPGDISLQLLFVIPPILTAHMAGVEAAGQLSFGLAVLTMASAPLSPLSVLLLPKSMKYFVQDSLVSLNKMVREMLRVVIAIYFIIGLVLFISSDLIVNIFLGENEITSFVIKGVSLATIPYAIYILLRSIIDAGARQAYNSFNCLITLFLFLILSQLMAKFLDTVPVMIFSIVIALYLLGALTYLRARVMTTSTPN